MKVTIEFEENEALRAGVLLGKTAIELSGKIEEIKGEDLPNVRRFTVTTNGSGTQGATSSAKSHL